MNTTTTPSSTQYNFSNEVDRVSIYVLPITMTLALITNTINILVLCRQTLRSSSCTHYFLAVSSASVLYITVAPMNVFVHSRFGILLTSTPFTCTTVTFAIYSSALFATLMLVSASVDRFFASSKSVSLRSWSQVFVARRMIIILSILTVVYMSPFYIIYYWDYTANRCSQHSTTLTVLYLSSRVVIYYIVAPLTMIIFGLLTIHNIHNQRRRVLPVLMNKVRQNSRRTEGQLARMLIIQVGSYIVFAFPSAIAYILITFVPAMATPFITSIRTVTILWQQGAYFLYSFRKRL
jgi:hypothetical protein